MADVPNIPPEDLHEPDHPGLGHVQAAYQLWRDSGAEPAWYDTGEPDPLRAAFAAGFDAGAAWLAADMTERALDAMRAMVRRGEPEGGGERPGEPPGLPG